MDLLILTLHTNLQIQIIGDLHHWNVWHGTHEPYQNWPELSGRFVSEFGMLSIPSLQTLTKYINESQLSINSTLLNFHTKAAMALKIWIIIYGIISLNRITRYFSLYLFDTITSIRGNVFSLSLLETELGKLYNRWNNYAIK